MPITNKIENLMLLLAAEEQYPPNELWRLNHSLASSAGAAAGLSVIGQSCWAHPLLLCREVWPEKPKPGWRWVGVERHQHTGARQPGILSLVLPLNLLVHWREGFVGGGLGGFLISGARMAFTENKNKLSRGERHSCSLLSGESPNLLFYYMLVQVPCPKSTGYLCDRCG